MNQFRTGQMMYDIFGYLLPGFFFLCLIIIDFDLGEVLKYYFSHNHSLKEIATAGFSYKLGHLFNFLTWNSDSDFKFTTGLMLLLFCYLLGHIIAAISSWVLEIVIHHKFLGFPSKNLLSTAKRNRFQKLFNHTKPFNEQFISDFKLHFAKRFGQVQDPQAYYWLCFSEVSRHHPVAYKRVIHFLGLYGFSRNVSAAIFIYCCSRILLHFCTHIEMTKYNLVLNLIFFAIGLLMFKNYLKLFYRQCTELYFQFYNLITEERQETSI